MSQIITPLNGGRERIQTSSNATFGTTLSVQYQEAYGLFETSTEWVSNGRPIYKRLPAASERYYVNFGSDSKIAYVYLQQGESAFGPNSLEIVATPDKKTLVVKPGTLVWEHGSLPITPVIINLEQVGMANSRYLLAYRLIHDDSPFYSLYSVDDYSLSGYEMNIVSSTDSVVGWRYEPKYAFCNNMPLEWRNYDGLFPSYEEDPSIYWQFTQGASFSKITLRCPLNTVVTGTATLSVTNCVNEGPTDPSDHYCSDPKWFFVKTVAVSKDDLGQFFTFTIAEPTFNTGWKIEWTDSKISIQSVTVSGTISLLRKPSTGKSEVSLVAYPVGTLPPTVVNSVGKEVPVTYCKLAQVDISPDFEVIKILDVRESVSTDYQPIADWLTKPWDDNLVSLYEQVNSFATLWMNPTVCLNQEYQALSDDLIFVEQND
jgi:hypothetical protein